MSAARTYTRLAVLAGLIGIGPVMWRPAHAGGVPEPGITMYGQILAHDGSIVTRGRLTWTLTPYDGSPGRIDVTVDLLPLRAAGTTFSYCIHLPAELPVAGQSLSANCLPVTAASAVYRREATLDGGFTQLVLGQLATTTFAVNERGKVERVDLRSGVFGPPDVPSLPAPVHGQVMVPLDTPLDWADAARAQTYDLYLWEAAYARPADPVLAGLTVSRLAPPAALRPDTVYAWQVIARNSEGATAGPEWFFRTMFQGDLQKILEYLLGKRDLTFAERRALDLNGDGDLDIADFIKGLNYMRYYSVNPALPLLDLVQKGGPPAPFAGVGPKAVSIRDEWVENNVVTPLTLPLYVAPGPSGVAGMNFHLEMNPMEIQLLAIRPAQSNSNEILYTHSPYAGVTNIVFFRDPVAAMQGNTSSTLLLDVRAMLPRPVFCSTIRLQGSLSDINGLPLPDVQKSGGMLRTRVRLDAGHWELYP